MGCFRPRETPLRTTMKCDVDAAFAAGTTCSDASRTPAIRSFLTCPDAGPETWKTVSAHVHFSTHGPVRGGSTNSSRSDSPHTAHITEMKTQTSKRQEKHRFFLQNVAHRPKRCKTRSPAKMFSDRPQPRVRQRMSPCHEVSSLFLSYPKGTQVSTSNCNSEFLVHVGRSVEAVASCTFCKSARILNRETNGGRNLFKVKNFSLGVGLVLRALRRGRRCARLCAMLSGNRSLACMCWGSSKILQKKLGVPLFVHCVTHTVLRFSRERSVAPSLWNLYRVRCGRFLVVVHTHVSLGLLERP